MPLPLPSLRAVVALYRPENEVNCGSKQLTLPLRITLKGPSRRYGFPRLRSAERHGPQNLDVQPQEDFDYGIQLAAQSNLTVPVAVHATPSIEGVV